MAYKDSIVEDFKKPEFASTIPGQYQEHFKKLGKPKSFTYNALNFNYRVFRPLQALYLQSTL